MIELDEALELIFSNADQLGTEERMIENAVGYVLARDVVSPINVAPFRNSAMDGFAVRSEWLDGCTKTDPKAVPIGSTVFAGDSASSCAADKHAVKVMTGAPVPDGFDTVVPFEDTEHTDDEVRFFNPVVTGRNIRHPGEDVSRGQKLFDKGAVLGRLDIGILAAVGLRTVLMQRKPSIKIVSLGDELAGPGEELAECQIYDSNTFTINSMVEPFCEQAERACRVPDKEDELKKVLDSSHDVIVTSGGVSAGERDLVVDLAESSGWQRVFHKARIKPGKPLNLAARGKQLQFGLPGNPLSTAVTCTMFLIPALKKMAGIAEYRQRSRPATMAADEVRKSNRTLIWPGFFQEKDGRTTARFSPKKTSAALTALLDTDGLIIQEAADGGGSEDVEVEIIPWSLEG